VRPSGARAEPPPPDPIAGGGTVRLAAGSARLSGPATASATSDATRVGEPDDPVAAPDTRTRTIALVSAKGGVGKTTTALNLAVAFAERGKATVLVDVDPQGGVALALARDGGEWAGLRELLAGEAREAEVVHRTRLDGLSIVHRGRLDAAWLEEYERLLGSGALDELLRALRGDVAYVVVDTPAGIGAITRAVLWAADFALVPVPVDQPSLRTLDQTLAAIVRARDLANPRLKLLGILPTMVALDDEASVDLVRTLRAERAGVLDTDIPRSALFAVASAKGLPISFLAGRPSDEARRFDALAAECEDLIAVLSGGAGGPAAAADSERPERKLL
jgi:chromosome partitioning protein